MPLPEPSWWYEAPPGARSRLLRPLARLYGWACERRLALPPSHRSPLPVLCIGNLTAGGTGKTPLTLACVEVLANLGCRPAVLSRGYGGRVRAPQFVDADGDRADAVGDEPLLMAQRVAVVVARDRAAGARLIEAAAPAFGAIVMDDGLQNPTLAKDLVIAVVDGRRGVGNGEVIPAGPLRARLEAQLPLVDAIVVNEPPGCIEDEKGTAAWLRERFEGPVLIARPEPVGDTVAMGQAPFVAFAGIANPARFFDLLSAGGGQIAARVTFDDHHAYTEADARRLLEMAEGGRRLITTQKDWVRLLGHDGSRRRLREASHTLPIRLAFEARDRERLASLLNGLMVHRAPAKA